MRSATPCSRSGLPRALSVALATTLALSLAGCGTTRRPAVAPPSAATPQDEGNWGERIRDAIAHLNRGDPEAARRELNAVLRGRPDHNIAGQLLRQIDTDPRILLGTQNYSYTLREGETLSTVAQRALGNPMMFYALARYNNIAVPSSIVPGQAILVPGRRPAAPPHARPEPRSTPARPAPPPAPETAAPAPRPAQRGNPAQASRLRGQGLAALNSGAVNRAVALLRQALSLDPGNAAIRNDLNRALRIQSTVRSRR